mmetsp:Transcript_28906/g.60451  ORF Transcript_28906/g.60451 Transcript_28906/m.60451 type:complete len:204 (+) Transcript_28906:1116-1727(+)
MLGNLKNKTSVDVLIITGSKAPATGVGLQETLDTHNFRGCMGKNESIAKAAFVQRAMNRFPCRNVSEGLNSKDTLTLICTIAGIISSSVIPCRTERSINDINIVKRAISMRDHIKTRNHGRTCIFSRHYQSPSYIKQGFGVVVENRIIRKEIRKVADVAVHCDLSCCTKVLRSQTISNYAFHKILSIVCPRGWMFLVWRYMFK